MKSYHLIKEDYEEIKSRLSMRQVVEFYGFKMNRKGTCLCPFHNDGHPSMKIYEKGFYCFTCGAGGDIIKFVAMLLQIGNESAARCLISEFALPIKTEGLSYREKRERELRQRERKALDTFTRYAEGVLKFYRRLLCEATHNPGGKHFAEAFQELSKVDYRLECLKKYPQEMYTDKEGVKWIAAVRERIIRWYDGTEAGGSVS